MSKKEKKAPYEKLEEAYALFNLVPELDLGKREKKVLRTISEFEFMDFYGLCDWLDLKPSKLDESLCVLDCLGLIDYDGEEEDYIVLSPLGERYMGTSKSEKKADKKLREFLDSLTEEELQEFCDMCSYLMYDEDMPVDAENDFEIEIVEEPVSEPAGDDAVPEEAAPEEKK